MRAKVIWFDKRDGVGFVRSTDGTVSGPIYACNIKGKRTWYPETACVYFDEGQEIDVTLQDGFIVTDAPGLFDQIKWDGLDHNRLAFRCDDTGKALNGLFASVEEPEDVLISDDVICSDCGEHAELYEETGTACCNAGSRF